MNTTTDNAQGLRALVRLFTSGYKSGHHDTVEGQFTDVYQSDLETYFEDQVREILAEPEYAALATHPPQQERAADARDAARYRWLLANRATYSSNSVPIQLIVCETHPVHRTRTQDDYRAQVDAAIGASIDIALAAAPAAPATPESAEPVAWVNRDELDNMLDDRTATVQGTRSGWCGTPLYAGPAITRTEAEAFLVDYHAEIWNAADGTAPADYDMAGRDLSKKFLVRFSPTPAASDPFPKDWCMRMAEREGDIDVTAGTYPPNKTLTLDLRDDEAKRADSRVAVVVNNNQPGSLHMVETAANTTLPVGTRLYAHPADSNGVTVADYEGVLASHRKLVRELDVLLNGEEGAAQQASLCDIVAQVAEQKRASDGGLREALAKLLQYSEAQICQHESTSRGGAIWEICDDCGEKWSDDRNPRPVFSWPAEITAARKVLATPQVSTPAAVAPEQVTEEDIAVLRRIRKALPDVGVNGWATGVATLDRVIPQLALRAAQQKGGGR